MIDLLLDALIAAIKLSDRGLAAVGTTVRRRLAPRAGDAQPAGAGQSFGLTASAGGHPIQSTSDLLYSAQLRLLYLGDYPEGLAPQLRDRAAQLRAEGD